MATVERNKGSYSKLGNGFQIKYPLGWNEQLGKYDVYNETLPTEAETIMRLKEINDFVYHGGDPKSLKYRTDVDVQKDYGKTTFEVFGIEYLKMREKKKQLKRISQRTVDTDRTHIARLNMYFAKMPIDQITLNTLEDAEIAMGNSSDRRNNGKALSGTYIRKLFITMQAMMNYAVKLRYIETNPCREHEKPKRDTKEKRSLDAEQAQTIVRSILDRRTPQSIGLLICMVGGCRLSEMLALTWNEVLIESNALAIKYSMERDTQKRKQPKTENSNAVVPIPPEATETLREWRKQQESWFKKHGLKHNDNAPVINSSKGEFILSSVYERWFRTNKAELGIPEFATIHTLRHSYITLSISECDTDLGTARGLARHGSLGVTSKYSHALEPQKIRTANRMGELLFPRKEQKTCACCRLWSVSPNDEKRGVCWGQEQARTARITNYSDFCAIERFEIRLARIS